MTKHRAPLTVEAALARIQGQLPNGIKEMMTVLGRDSESIIRAWGDPDRRENICVEDAITLDLAYQAAGGHGFPMHEFYTLQLELQTATMFAEQVELGSILKKVIKENSEAEIAILDATRPDATPMIMRETMREIEEAIATLRAPLAIVKRLYGQATGVSESMAP